MSDGALVIEELRARVEELERLLVRRSAELKATQRLLSVADLLVLARVSAGRPPLAGLAYSPSSWDESTSLRRLDVADTMTDLWHSRPARLSEVAELAAGVAFPLPNLESWLAPGAMESWTESTSLESTEVAVALRKLWGLSQ